MRDYTVKEAEIALKRGVDALFAESRDCEPTDADGRSHTKTGVAYVVFSNGAVKIEGERSAPTDTSDYPRLENVAATIRAVKAHYWNADHQRVVWRSPPEYEAWPKSRRFKTEAGQATRIRIAAEPLAGNL